jgi:hypothetical protein
MTKAKRGGALTIDSLIDSGYEVIGKEGNMYTLQNNETEEYELWVGNPSPPRAGYCIKLGSNYLTFDSTLDSPDEGFLKEAKQVGSATIDSLKDSGYEVVGKEGNRYTLQDNETGELELWIGRTSPCAGYCIKVGSHYLEFASSIDESAEEFLKEAASSISTQRHAKENFNTGLSKLLSASMEMRRVLGTLFDVASYQKQGLKIALENTDFREDVQYKINTVLRELEKHKKDIELLMRVSNISINK